LGVEWVGLLVGVCGVVVEKGQGCVGWAVGGLV
jgi:hypothetical protein